MKDKRGTIIGLFIIGLAPLMIGFLMTTLLTLGIANAETDLLADLLHVLIPPEIFSGLYVAIVSPLSLCCFYACYKTGRYSAVQGVEEKWAWAAAMGPMLFFVALTLVQLLALGYYIPFIGPISQCYLLPFLGFPSTVVSLVGTVVSVTMFLPMAYILCALTAGVCFYCGRRSGEEPQDGLLLIPAGSALCGFVAVMGDGGALTLILRSGANLLLYAFAFVLVMTCAQGVKSGKNR